MAKKNTIKEAFIKTIEFEGEWFLLDNLNEACLTFIKGEVKVMNEHGTIFEFDELSKSELNTLEFIYTNFLTNR